MGIQLSSCKRYELREVRFLADDVIQLAQNKTNVAVFLRDKLFFKVKTKSVRYKDFLTRYGENLVGVFTKDIPADHLIDELKGCYYLTCERNKQ